MADCPKGGKHEYRKHATNMMVCEKCGHRVHVRHMSPAEHEYAEKAEE